MLNVLSAPNSEGGRDRTPLAIEGSKVGVIATAVIDTADKRPGNTECLYDGSIATAVIDTADKRPGNTECLYDGSIVTQISIDVERAGSTVALLVADAWKILCTRYKAALLRELGKKGSEEANDLINMVVKDWAQGYGRSYKDDENNVEAFDFTAAACISFIEAPETFGHTAGSTRHKAAIKMLEKPLRAAFESEIVR